jgi:hypothetical protein
MGDFAMFHVEQTIQLINLASLTFHVEQKQLTLAIRSLILAVAPPQVSRKRHHSFGR